MRGPQANNPVQPQAAIDAEREYRAVLHSVHACFNFTRRWSERRCIPPCQADLATAFGVLLGAVENAYLAGGRNER